MRRCEVLQKVRAYSRQGWNIFPHDDPEKYLLGYIAIDPSNALNSRIYQWDLFDKSLIFNYMVLDCLDDMIDFVYKGPLYKYDDPRACLLGAVKFIPEDEKLIARRIRVTTLSRGGFEKNKSYSELIKRNLATGNTPAIREYAINRMMIDLEVSRNSHGPYR